MDHSNSDFTASLTFFELWHTNGHLGYTGSSIAIHFENDYEYACTMQQGRYSYPKQIPLSCEYIPWNPVQMWKIKEVIIDSKSDFIGSINIEICNDASIKDCCNFDAPYTTGIETFKGFKLGNDTFMYELNCLMRINQ